MVDGNEILFSDCFSCSEQKAIIQSLINIRSDFLQLFLSNVTSHIYCSLLFIHRSPPHLWPPLGHSLLSTCTCTLETGAVLEGRVAVGSFASTGSGGLQLVG